MKLHEAWFEIAKRLSEGRETWICNAAGRLAISGLIYEEILRRVEVERQRQRAKHALWTHLHPHTTGRVARIRFIASELRRLA
jgi:hypothetical protein